MAIRSEYINEFMKQCCYVYMYVYISVYLYTYIFAVKTFTI